MVDYARFQGARPLLLVQGGLVHLPPGQDPEQAYDGICFPERSGHGVFDKLVAAARSQATKAGVFQWHVDTQQSIFDYHEDNKKNANVEWRKWRDSRL